MAMRIVARMLAAFSMLLAAAVHAQSADGNALPQRVFDFDVYLERRPIGTHRFSLAPAGDGALTVLSEASFDVRFLGIAAYRYRHRATEHWRGDCLAAIDASTDDDGRRLRVTGMQREGRFQLETPASGTLPSCISAYAYWNRDLLLRQRALLNPQTGQFDSLRVESLGTETLQAAGTKHSAQHYRLHAARSVIDLWYAPAGDWLRLESAVGSRRLIYVRR
jgi:hypothetical protein